MADTEPMRASEPHYETRDIGPGFAVLAAVGLVAAVAGPLVVVTALYDALWRRAELPPERMRTPAEEGVTMAPTLQVAPSRDFAAFSERVRRQLDELGWVDREQGIAHIPIEEAMRLHLNRSGREAE